MPVTAVVARTRFSGDDVISSKDVETLRFTLVQICGLLISVVLEQIKTSLFAMRRRRLVHSSPIFMVDKQKCLMGYATENEALESLF